MCFDLRMFRISWNRRNMYAMKSFFLRKSERTHPLWLKNKQLIFWGHNMKKWGLEDLNLTGSIKHRATRVMALCENVKAARKSDGKSQKLLKATRDRKSQILMITHFLERHGTQKKLLYYSTSKVVASGLLQVIVFVLDRMLNLTRPHSAFDAQIIFNINSHSTTTVLCTA